MKIFITCFSYTDNREVKSLSRSHLIVDVERVVKYAYNVLKINKRNITVITDFRINSRFFNFLNLHGMVIVKPTMYTYMKMLKHHKEVFFFWSCHGVKKRGLGILFHTGRLISSRRLSSTINTCRKVVCVLDCCYAQYILNLRNDHAVLCSTLHDQKASFYIKNGLRHGSLFTYCLFFMLRKYPRTNMNNIIGMVSSYMASCTKDKAQTSIILLSKNSTLTL